MSFFCNLPFTELHTNGMDARPCCVFKTVKSMSINRYFDDPEFLSAKQQLLAGQAPEQCSFCYNQEKNNNNSFRKIAEDFHPDLSKEIRERNDPAYFDLKHISYTTSNICNLKCLPCRGASFVRDAELKKLGISDYTPTLMQNSNFSNIINKDFERLTVLGGEPFYDQVTFQLLEELVRTGKSKNIQVDLNTNMTAVTAGKMDFLVNNFRKVLIKASIDGIGPVNEYLRYPSKWDEIEKNIRLVQGYPDVDIVITSAVSNLAFLKFYQVIEWAAENQFNLFLTHVGHPNILTAHFLPAIIKSKLLEIYQEQKQRLGGKIRDRTEYCIDSCIHVCSKTDTDLSSWPNFIEWIGKHDQLRKTNVLSVFPELAEYF